MTNRFSLLSKYIYCTFDSSVQPSVEGMTDPLAEHNSQERTPAERKKQMLRKLPGKEPKKT